MNVLDYQPASEASDRRRLRDRPAEAGVVVVLVLLFLGVGYSTVYRAAALGGTERSDFTVYHAAGEAVLDGTNIYEAQNVRGWLYMYLPIFAVLMVPLAVLPKTVAAGVFYLLSVAALAHLTWISARLATSRGGAGPPPRLLPRWRDVRAPLPVFWVGLAALLLTGWPWMSGLTRGQASILLSWLTTLSVALFLRSRPAARWAGGFALALATLIRVFPGLLGFWLILRGKWRAVLACVVGGLTLFVVVPSLVFGPRGNAALVRQWVRTVALPNDDAAAEKQPALRANAQPAHRQEPERAGDADPLAGPRRGGRRGGSTRGRRPPRRDGDQRRALAGHARRLPRRAAAVGGRR